MEHGSKVHALLSFDNQWTSGSSRHPSSVHGQAKDRGLLFHQHQLHVSQQLLSRSRCRDMFSSLAHVAWHSHHPLGCSTGGLVYLDMCRTFAGCLTATKHSRDSGRLSKLRDPRYYPQGSHQSTRKAVSPCTERTSHHHNASSCRSLTTESGLTARMGSMSLLLTVETRLKAREGLMSLSLTIESRLTA